MAPIAQSAEADDLKSSKSGFESLWGHRMRGLTEWRTSARHLPMSSPALERADTQTGIDE